MPPHAVFSDICAAPPKFPDRAAARARAIGDYCEQLSRRPARAGWRMMNYESAIVNRHSYHNITNGQSTRRDRACAAGAGWNSAKACGVDGTVGTFHWSDLVNALTHIESMLLIRKGRWRLNAAGGHCVPGAICSGLDTRTRGAAGERMLSRGQARSAPRLEASTDTAPIDRAGGHQPAKSALTRRSDGESVRP